MTVDGFTERLAIEAGIRVALLRRHLAELQPSMAACCRTRNWPRLLSDVVHLGVLVEEARARREGRRAPYLETRRDVADELEAKIEASGRSVFLLPELISAAVAPTRAIAREEPHFAGRIAVRVEATAFLGEKPPPVLVWTPGG